MSAVKEIVMVHLNEIVVPRERVTSVWTPELEQEFHNSVVAKGILEPLRILRVDKTLYLVDGLHRIQKAEELEIEELPAIIKDGTVEDLLIENIIANRQRGRSNPAQEAEVLDYLVTKRGFPLENASKQLGLSSDWSRMLLKIAHLPDIIKDMIKHDKIPVTGARYLADLSNPEEQGSVATDAAAYGYTAAQIKARVSQLLNPDVEPEGGDVTFAENGRPTVVPLRCSFCGKELPTIGKNYVWSCGDCDTLAHDLLADYQGILKEERERIARTSANP